MVSRESLTNVFSLMVDDWTNQWYHSKTKTDRVRILDEVREYLKHRRRSEEHPDPNVSVLREELDRLEAEMLRHSSSMKEAQTKSMAIKARLDELEAAQDQLSAQDLDDLKQRHRELRMGARNVEL